MFLFIDFVRVTNCFYDYDYDYDFRAEGNTLCRIHPMALGQVGLAVLPQILRLHCPESPFQPSF